jgi:hypothetical protein
VNCPDPSVLFDLAQGLTPPQGRQTLEAHLDSCASCRKVLAAAGERSGPGADTGSVTRPSPARPVVELAAGTRVGRFVVLERAGTGGMGVVYAAYDPLLDRRCALKLLLASAGPADDAEQRAQVLREGRALAF